MLASLLPGLRHLRGPLTVGYMWLLVLWLLFADHLPRNRPSGNGALAKLFDLGDLLGPAVVLGAVSFVAYLIGSLMFLNPAGMVLRFPILPLSNNPFFVTRKTGQEFEDWLEAQSPDTAERAEALLRDPRRLEAKLRVAGADLNGDYDRLRAEGELRLNITLPLVALSIVLGMQMSLWFLLGVVLAFIFAGQGYLRLIDAGELAFQAIMAEVIPLVP